MKKGSTLFLKLVISVVGIVILAGLIWFPQTEGRAANLDLVHIYADPLIMYVYVASIPFFVGLYQAIKILGYVDRNKVFSQSAVNALRTIKYCALAIPALIILALVYIRFYANGDDSAGPTAVGIVTSIASIVVATAAATFEKLLRNVVDIKSENDLTV